MTFEVTILGNGSATPTLKHNPSAQVVNVHDKLFLVDCGEGTQLQLRRYEIKFQRINHIFISHLHGDHYLGLPGYISTMHLLGRHRELHVYGPQDLKELLDLNLKYSQSFLDYTLTFHPLDFKQPGLIYEDRTMEVHSFPLKHRIECCGFMFREKQRLPKLRKEIVEQFSLEPSDVVALKNGNDITLASGHVLRHAEVCEPADAPRSYAYCSDTMYWETLPGYISEANLLYHEATFLENEKERARSTFHSTASEAAKIAAMSKAGKLILGHYSGRYKNLDLFLEEARLHFPETELSVEGETYRIT